MSGATKQPDERTQYDKVMLGHCYGCEREYSDECAKAAKCLKGHGKAFVRK